MRRSARHYPAREFYAATKAEVLILTRRVAMETGRRGVTVNAVAPGWIVTEMGTSRTQRGGVPDAGPHYERAHYGRAGGAASRTATLPICLPPRALGSPPAGAVAAELPFRALLSAPLLPNSVSTRSATSSSLSCLQRTQLLCQPSPFRVEPGKPFGNLLLILSNLVQCRRLHFPSRP